MHSTEQNICGTGMAKLSIVPAAKCKVAAPLAFSSLQCMLWQGSICLISQYMRFVKALKGKMYFYAAAIECTSTTVLSSSWYVLIKAIVFSQHCLNTPSIPVRPIPSTRSLVSRKGTVSGVGSVLPCPKATPGKWRVQPASKLKQEVRVYLSRCE